MVASQDKHFMMTKRVKKKLRSVRYSVGVDEVGRGPLAGPVVVCAVAIPVMLTQRGAVTRHSTMRPHGGILWHTTRKIDKIELPLRDSKKLTEKQREAWYAHLTKHPRIRYAIARVYPRQIERRNISRAANLAAARAFARLAGTFHASRFKFHAYLDGGLYLGNSGERKKIKPGLVRIFLRLSTSGPRLSATTVVRGDEKITAVAMASIIAKVHRDRLMKRLAKKYPGYGFELHKGYGTRAHLAAIRRLGPSPVHRKTFLS